MASRDVAHISTVHYTNGFLSKLEILELLISSCELDDVRGCKRFRG